MFESRYYEVRREFGFGTAYHIYENQTPILKTAYSTLQRSESFRFSDPQTGTDQFGIRETPTATVDEANTYDIIDAQTGERVGTVRRNVISHLQHEYTLSNDDGHIVATLREDRPPVAVARRLLSSILPFSCEIIASGGTQAGIVTGALSIRDQFSIELFTTQIDPQLAVVGTIVADAIEDIEL